MTKAKAVSKRELANLEREIRGHLKWCFRVLAVDPQYRPSVLRSRQVRRCAEQLISDWAYSWKGIAVDFYRLELPGDRLLFFIPRKFNALKRPPSQRRKCLVACRFIEEVQSRLESVLEPIFSYYGYELVFVGDLGRDQILKQVLDHLKSGEIAFALFDTFRTSRKPNVFIELGIAYALDKPFILLEHETAVLPTDLGGLITLRYSGYRELARELTTKLPTFMDLLARKHKKDRRAQQSRSSRARTSSQGLPASGSTSRSARRRSSSAR